MKMNFKYLTMFAAAAAIGFSSCSNEDDVNNPIGKGDTKFSLKIDNPVTYADANAATGESTIKTVDVYVFKENGAFETHKTLNWESDFNTTTGELKSDSRIDAFTGKKKIYVGINLPTAIATAIENNGPSAAATIAAVAELSKANEFVMFSKEAAEPTLEVEADENNVSVTVTRLVAKTAFYADKSSFNVNGAGGTATNLQFAVGNVNNKFFPLPTADFSDPNFEPADESASFLNTYAYKTVNPTATTIADADVVYLTENSVKGTPVQGSSTYGIVSVDYTPAQTATYTSGNLTLTDGFTTGTFHLVKSSQGNLFFSNKAQAEGYVTANDGDIAKDIVTYTNGKMYYPVYLQHGVKGTASKFSVYRNNIYKVTIESINGLGSYTDEPGDEDEPGIIDPKEPIVDEVTTKITVTVSIANWETPITQSEILQGK